MIKILYKAKFMTLFKHVHWKFHQLKTKLSKKKIITCSGTMRQIHKKIINKKVTNLQKC